MDVNVGLGVYGIGEPYNKRKKLSYKRPFTVTLIWCATTKPRNLKTNKPVSISDIAFTRNTNQSIAQHDLIWKSNRLLGQSDQ